MSQKLISLSPDLKRLRDEGYHVEVASSHLLVKDVPYVNAAKQIKRGTLVSTLQLAADVTIKPDTHVVHFVGEYPCDKEGARIVQINNASERKELVPGIIIDHTFSSRPDEGYPDYYEKMTTYVKILSNPAVALDPTVLVRTYPVIASPEDESVFCYVDTASSRAEITAMTKKLEVGKIAIIGLGGTGSYVLDLVAKTPVKEIHLFDGDVFSQHNAFRSPGAASLEDLRQQLQKVHYLREKYSKMHRGIVAHDAYINETNITQLQGMNFVFLCLDKGKVKQLVVERLEAMGVFFIDVGMGINIADESLHGVLRVTTSTTANRDHVRDKHRISFSDDPEKDDYSRNIQVADLNALNAALAVIKWKKLLGFYSDFEKEHFSTYTLDGNMLTNEDQP